MHYFKKCLAFNLAICLVPWCDWGSENFFFFKFKARIKQRQTYFCQRVNLFLNDDVISLCVAGCPHQQVYSNCASSCPFTCEDLWPHTQCLPGPCTAGCVCPPGQVCITLSICVTSVLYVTVNSLIVSCAGVLCRFLHASVWLSLFNTLYAQWVPKLEHKRRGLLWNVATTWNICSAPL